MVSIPIVSIVTKGLGILGRLGKGKATKAGVATIVASAVGIGAVPQLGLTEGIEAITQLVFALTALVGAISTAFGVGRKAMKQAIVEG